MGLLLAAILAVLTMCAGPTAVLAHPGVCADPSLQLLELTFAGPYVVSVSVNPARPIVGGVQLVVGVCDGDTLTPVENARVELTPINPAGKPGAVIRALGRVQSTEEYGADLKIRQPGTWRYKVHVEGPDGPADVEAPLEVLPSPGYDEGSSVVFFGVNAVLLIGGAYVIWQIRRNKRPDPRAASTGSLPR